MRGIKLVVWFSLLFLIIGCSNSSSGSGSDSGSNSSASEEENNPSSTNTDDNSEKVRDFLELEFTGPNKKIEEIYSNNSNGDLNEYVDDTYKPFFNERSYEQSKEKRYFLLFNTPAYLEGYELKPLEIIIEEDEGNNAYSFEVNVEYSKGEEADSTIVKGRVNFDGNGKFSRIRYSDRGGLLEAMRTPKSSGSSSSEPSTEEGEEINKSESKQNIRAALEGVLNGPNEDLKEAMEGMNKHNDDMQSEDYKKHFADFSDYYKENFKPYVTDRLYKSSNTSELSSFIERVHPGGKLETENLSMEEKEGYYDFSLDITYTDTQSGESETTELRGHAQTNDEGKVSSIKFINLQDVPRLF